MNIEQALRLLGHLWIYDHVQHNYRMHVYWNYLFQTQANLMVQLNAEDLCVVVNILPLIKSFTNIKQPLYFVGEQH